MTLRYLSVCSGIEAATAAWHHMGWTPVGFAEIEPFPSAVLAHHYPGVPNYGDLTKYEEWPIKRGDVDLIVGGTPCQAFSIAGLRGGLSDARGNLALSFCRMVDHFRPRWVLWENVPGVLSSNGGRDFGSIIGALAECGYGFSYRVFDAQYFGVPQRRRRVFLLAFRDSGDWQPAATVLLEPESMRRNPAARGEARPRSSSAASTGAGNGGRTSGRHAGFRMTAFGEYADDDSASTLKMRDYKDATDLVVAAGHEEAAARAVQTFTAPATGTFQESNVAGTLMRHNGQGAGETQNAAFVLTPALTVRRLTPVECERLQGFPDSFTRIPWKGKPAAECPDTPRYKALGNSMAVPVMRWIGERINQVEKNLADED